MLICLSSASTYGDFQGDFAEDTGISYADNNGNWTNDYSDNSGDANQYSTQTCPPPTWGETNAYLAFETGYRWDRISNRAILGGSTVPAKGSTQLIRRINSWQVGGKAQFATCNGVFVRGNGHYGWIFDGAKYSEGGLFGDSGGHTWDAEAAIGQYIWLSPGIWFAPVIGWSYDTLLLKGKNIRTAINGEFFRLRDIQAHQRVSGPFIGFDLNYQVNSCFDFLWGYEFHYAHWHGQRIIQGRDFGNPPFGITTGYSNKRHLHDVYGQVFKLDASYQICDCWELGLGLKYQFFTGDDGHYRQTKKRVISQYSYRKIDGLWWQSFAAMFYLGKMF